MIKTNWIKNFSEIVDKLDKLFNEVDDPDYNWRCRYSWLLFYCLYDSDKKPDAIKVNSLNKKIIENLFILFYIKIKINLKRSQILYGKKLKNNIAIFKINYLD